MRLPLPSTRHVTWSWVLGICLVCQPVLAVSPSRVHEAEEREGRERGRPPVHGILEERPILDDAPVPPAWPTVTFRAQSVSPNIRINDPLGDGPSESQSETAAAAWGSKVVVGWNDALGFTIGNTISSYGYSIDGGGSWTDGGNMPLQGLGTGEQLYGDPGVCADRHGRFWFCSLYFQPGDISAIGVTRIDFTGASPVLSPPVAVNPTLPDFLDKCHIACDPDSGYVYVGYIRYFGGGGYGQMESSRSLDGGLTFGPPVILQPLITGDSPQGARLLVDDLGNVHYFFEDGLGNALGGGQHSYIAHAVSTNHGASFGPVDSIAVVHQNWMAAPPGFNRRDGFFEFPDVAVDRSSGPRRGTIYVGWNEGCEPQFSFPATSRAEVEPNNSLPTNDSLAVPARITGSISPASDTDFFRFEGSAGQMVALLLHPSAALSPWLRLSNAPLGDTLLLDSRNGTGLDCYGWVSLPSSGTYTIRVNSVGGTSGTYTLDVDGVTRAGGPALDHRDVVVTSSADHGATWSPPRRVNDDGGNFDNCMPMLSVDTLGYAHVFWYDRRNDPLRGGRADVHYSRSGDGGLSWSGNVRITDQATTWQVPSRIAPNFGDYSGAVSTGNRSLPIFADGRFGNPDVFTSVVRSGFQLVCAHDTLLLAGDTLRATYFITNLAPFPEVFRFDVTDSLGLFAALHDSVALAPQGAASFTFQRAIPGATPGMQDALRLAGCYRSASWDSVRCRSGLQIQGGTVAAEGAAVRDALGAPFPNPSAGRVRLRYALAHAGLADVALYGVDGRRVATLARGRASAGWHSLDWESAGRVASGLYFVRARLGGETFVRRLMVLQ